MKRLILAFAVFALVLVSSADAGGFGINVNVGGGRLFGRRALPPVQRGLSNRDLQRLRDLDRLRDLERAHDLDRLRGYGSSSFRFSGSYGGNLGFGASAGGCGAFLSY